MNILDQQYPAGLWGLVIALYAMIILFLVLVALAGLLEFLCKHAYRSWHVNPYRQKRTWGNRLKCIGLSLLTLIWLVVTMAVILDNPTPDQRNFVLLVLTCVSIQTFCSWAKHYAYWTLCWWVRRSQLFHVYCMHQVVPEFRLMSRLGRAGLIDPHAAKSLYHTTPSTTPHRSWHRL